MKQAFKLSIKLLARPLMFLGFNPFALINLRYFPLFINQARTFKKMGGEITHYFPILSDYKDQSGSAKGHYYHQDLLVASFINEKKPDRHIDIGSRVDGFVAHVASFRPIEIVDIRPLTNGGHDNIRYHQGYLMNEFNDLPISDSVSCLHVIEHFGLGRYGDIIDPDGHKKGFKNLLKLVQKGGTLYISFPIGKKNEIEYNAHRVFHPLDILNWYNDKSIEIIRFDYVDDEGVLHKHANLFDITAPLIFGCGIYTIKKN